MGTGAPRGTLVRPTANSAPSFACAELLRACDRARRTTCRCGSAAHAWLDQAAALAQVQGGAGDTARLGDDLARIGADAHRVNPRLRSIRGRARLDEVETVRGPSRCMCS